MYRLNPIPSISRIFILLLLFWFSFASAQEQYVYVTKTGAKYHKSDCRYLKYSKIEMSLKEAVAKDYTACSVCKPSGSKSPEVLKKDSVVHIPAKGSETGAKKSVTTRCTATTQAGTRCKRMTKEANGKCWQHQ